MACYDIRQPGACRPHRRPPPHPPRRRFGAEERLHGSSLGAVALEGAPLRGRAVEHLLQVGLPSLDPRTYSEFLGRGPALDEGLGGGLDLAERVAHAVALRVREQAHDIGLTVIGAVPRIAEHRAWGARRLRVRHHRHTLRVVRTERVIFEALGAGPCAKSTARGARRIRVPEKRGSVGAARVRCAARALPARLRRPGRRREARRRRAASARPALIETVAPWLRPRLCQSCGASDHSAAPAGISPGSRP